MHHRKALHMIQYGHERFYYSHPFRGFVGNESGDCYQIRLDRKCAHYIHICTYTHYIFFHIILSSVWISVCATPVLQVHLGIYLSYGRVYYCFNQLQAFISSFTTVLYHVYGRYLLQLPYSKFSSNQISQFAKKFLNYANQHHFTYIPA